MNANQNSVQVTKALLDTSELASLGPQPRASRASLDTLEGNLARLFSETKVTPSAQPLIRSLVLLWHDYLDESHSISQNIHSADGSFLHGIMHRREPDYGNAKYWFQRAGEHVCFPVIAEKAAEIFDAAKASTWKATLIRDNKWDASAFVDACEEAMASRNEETILLLQQIQKIEFATLLEHFLH